MFESKLMITKEFLAHAMGLPESITVTTMEYNVNRGILNVYLSSGEKIEGVTFERVEGQETATIPAGAWAAKESQTDEA